MMVTYYDRVFERWPRPDVRGSTEFFKAARAVVIAMAEKHITDAHDLNRVNSLVRGNIRYAIEVACQYGVPRKEIYTPILFLLGTLPDR
jgi:hypothetical protein